MKKYILLAISCLSLMGAHASSPFTLQSSAFANNDRIPVLYSCNGKNISPPLNWANAPENTKSFALILSIPDAAFGGTFYSWVLFNIPSGTTELKEGGRNIPETVSTGSNSFGYTQYYGPCPRDDREHHYVFTLYALDGDLNAPDGAEVTDVLDEINKHVIGTTQLTGLFSH